MGITFASKEIVAALENPTKAWKLGPLDSIGLVDVTETLLRIDPDVRTALPEGILDSGKVRNSAGINLSAPLSLWKQTHEALKKRYPPGIAQTPSEGPKVEPGKVVPKQAAGEKGPLFQNRPASFWRDGKTLLAVGLYSNGIRFDSVDDRQLPSLWRQTLEGL